MLALMLRRHWQRRHFQRLSLLPLITIEAQKDVPLVARTAFLEALVQALRKEGFILHLWAPGKNARQTRLAVGNSNVGLSDETFILSRVLPTWVCKDPANAMDAAAHEGATILVSTKRTSAPSLFSIGLVGVSISDAQQDITSSLSAATFHRLSQMDAIVCVGKSSGVPNLSLLHRPVYQTQWTLHSSHITKDQNVIGFTSLEDGGAFYHTLIQQGYTLKGFVPLPRIKRHPERQLGPLLRMATNEKATLATSQRDLAFLPASSRKQLETLSLTIEIDPNLIQEIVRVYKTQCPVAPEDSQFRTA